MFGVEGLAQLLFYKKQEMYLTNFVRQQLFFVELEILGLTNVQIFVLTHQTIEQTFQMIPQFLSDHPREKHNFISLGEMCTW